MVQNPPQQPVKLQCWMFPKLNDFLQVQLVLLTSWKSFCWNLWRCSGLFRALEAGTALKGWGSDAGTLHSEDSAALWTWTLCPSFLLAVPKDVQVTVGGWLSPVNLQLLSALCLCGVSLAQRCWPLVPVCVCGPLEHFFVLPCSLQHGLLLNEYWMSSVSSLVHAGVAGLWEGTVKTTASCVPGDCWEWASFQRTALVQL